MPRIPLIEDLTTGPLPAGSTLFTEYDPASQWYNALSTIAAGWIKTGGKVEYYLTGQPRDDLRSQLNLLGLDIKTLKRVDRLRIVGVYTCQLGQKSREKYSYDSLKVADISIQYARDFMRLPAVSSNLTAAYFTRVRLSVIY